MLLQIRLGFEQMSPQTCYIKTKITKSTLVVFILSIVSFGIVSTLNHTITLKGDKFVTIALNEEYKELGASNTFNDSKYIDISGEVDNTKVGTYKIEYKSNLFITCST